MSSRWLTLILVVAFALRAVAVIKLGGGDPSPDALDDYLPIAANLMAGNGFINGANEPDYVRGPAFPLFVALAQLVLPGGSNMSVLWLQALADTMTATLIAGITRRAIGPVASLVAAGLYAMNPLAIYSCTILGPEILTAFLLTAAVAAYMRSIETAKRCWMAMAGHERAEAEVEVDVFVSVHVMDVAGLGVANKKRIRFVGAIIAGYAEGKALKGLLVPGARLGRAFLVGLNFRLQNFVHGLSPRGNLGPRLLHAAQVEGGRPRLPAPLLESSV